MEKEKRIIAGILAQNIYFAPNSHYKVLRTFEVDQTYRVHLCVEETEVDEDGDRARFRIIHESETRDGELDYDCSSIHRTSYKAIKACGKTIANLLLYTAGIPNSKTDIGIVMEDNEALSHAWKLS